MTRRRFPIIGTRFRRFSNHWNPVLPVFPIIGTMFSRISPPLPPRLRASALKKSPSGFAPAVGHSPRHSSFVIRHSSHSSLVTRHSSLLPLALPALFALFFSLAPLARSASLPADDQLRFADGIFLRGLHEDAIHEYVAFARDYPADPRLDQVFFRLGECYRRLTNDTAALRFYARVEKDFPASPSAPKAALRRAEIALAASRFDEAAALAQASSAASLVSAEYAYALLVPFSTRTPAPTLR